MTALASRQRLFWLTLLVVAVAGVLVRGDDSVDAGPPALVVDRIDDDVTATECTDAANDCSLRGAIINANHLPRPTRSAYRLHTQPHYRGALARTLGVTGDLDVTGDLTINGAGTATTIIDGGDLDRVFHILSGMVDISGVTIQNGAATGGPFDAFGGGIYNTSKPWR